MGSVVLFLRCHFCHHLGEYVIILRVRKVSAMIYCPQCHTDLNDALDFAAIAPLCCPTCGCVLSEHDILHLPVEELPMPQPAPVSPKITTVVDSYLVYL